MKKPVLDNLSDEEIKAMIFDLDGHSFDDVDDTEHEFSERHQKRMQKLFDDLESKEQDAKIVQFKDKKRSRRIMFTSLASVAAVLVVVVSINSPFLNNKQSAEQVVASYSNDTKAIGEKSKESDTNEASMDMAVKPLGSSKSDSVKKEKEDWRSERYGACDDSDEYIGEDSDVAETSKVFLNLLPLSLSSDRKFDVEVVNTLKTDIIVKNVLEIEKFVKGRWVHLADVYTTKGKKKSFIVKGDATIKKFSYDLSEIDFQADKLYRVKKEYTVLKGKLGINKVLYKEIEIFE